MTHQRIVILDFGSQYTQLIARRIREFDVFCEIFLGTAPVGSYADRNLIGIILSGGPASVAAPDAPHFPEEILRLRKPILGICYGLQLLAHRLGGKVARTHAREYGRAELRIKTFGKLFAGLQPKSVVWMSHGDTVVKLPPGFAGLATTPQVKFAAFGHAAEKIYAVQFHPEVAHTEGGQRILRNFVLTICGARGDWTVRSFISESTARIQATADSLPVVCGISGGVDSTVCALLIHRAIGKNLIPIFIDNGLLRAGEAAEVQKLFARLKIPLRTVDASQRFLSALAGVSEPETKRKIIGHVFIETFAHATRQLGEVKFLAQGTLYPDVIESQSVRGPSATIKTHHNVGGLPADLKFQLIEPLRNLFKDEVRAVGRKLGVPAQSLGRHPFPGPGLAVRIIGEVTPERLELLRRADFIFIQELRKAKLYDQIWQAFVVLLPVKTVGVMGDERTYENVCALRAVTSRDGMTADWARLPDAFLARVSARIINEVKGINRVVYDISSKPPATIEWE